MLNAIPDSGRLEGILLAASNILLESQTHLGNDYQMEISHHYGLDNFPITGAIIINLINRSYCKKFIILSPEQSHPTHYHKKKEETFRLLHGDLTVVLEEQAVKLGLGDSLLVRPGRHHSFSSQGGCLFEEISTHHYSGDSYYLDPLISEKSLHERKTIIETPFFNRYLSSDYTYIKEPK
ncbi:cupin domain-containing protein [Paenibacillus sp. NPDC058071]|uniref:cupin domain-containing protein n=1 Tax=Paenibacillus sp. NPDC058071 TaxID=3346326 RepID=UPI0036DE4353